MSSPSTDSTLPTLCADLEFDGLSSSSDLQDVWSIHPFAMVEQSFSEQHGRLPATSQEWTPSSAVSSFNLPIIYDSSLTTPVSLHPDSPNPQGKSLTDAQWNPPELSLLQYPVRSNDSVFESANSMSMKSKNSSISMSSSDADNVLVISSYLFDSPSTPCPPTPYWGSFGVSATSVTAASTSANIQSSANHPMFMNALQSGINQAPILTAPHPPRRPRQRHSTENHIQKQHDQQTQMRTQVQLPKAHSSPTGSKRECLSPTPKSKRRRQSVQSAEQQKALSRDDLNEEDKILLRLRDLKEEKKWDWKELTDRFNQETGGRHTVAALQMRYTRLAEKMRVWTEADISALKQAKAHYDNQKWKLVAQSMPDYGCETKWSPHACQMKWQELHPDEETYEEYRTGSGDENILAISTPQPKDSGITFPCEELERDAGDGNAPLIVGQTNQVCIRQRTGSKGSSRSSKSGYEQRQEWTIRH